MILISKQQVNALRAERHSAFHRRLRADILGFMRRTAPDTPAEEVAARIDAALDGAASHGMVTEQQIVRYAYILAAFPADHASREEHAWLSALLGGTNSADARLDQVTAALTHGASR